MPPAVRPAAEVIVLGMEKELEHVHKRRVDSPPVREAKDVVVRGRDLTRELLASS